MMVGSVMGEGLRGMQSAQREMQRAASDIARTSAGVQPVPQADPAAAASVLPPVQESVRSSETGIEEPLIEMRRQEQLFTASAKVVSIANQTLGSLIDVTS